eukprot:scaffold76339_cov64-Phaeocystis_antarctica.AAC.1
MVARLRRRAAAPHSRCHPLAAAHALALRAAWPGDAGPPHRRARAGRVVPAALPARAPRHALARRRTRARRHGRRCRLGAGGDAAARRRVCFVRARWRTAASRQYERGG